MLIFFLFAILAGPIFYSFKCGDKASFLLVVACKGLYSCIALIFKWILNTTQTIMSLTGDYSIF